MNLPPYPNLCKAEKLKSQSTLRILQRDFYSVYLTHQLCNKWLEGVKVFYFNSFCFSPIIVYNVFYIKFLRVTSAIKR